MLVNMLSKSDDKEILEILENVCNQIMSHEIEQFNNYLDSVEDFENPKAYH